MGGCVSREADASSHISSVAPSVALESRHTSQQSWLSPPDEQGTNETVHLPIATLTPQAVVSGTMLETEGTSTHSPTSTSSAAKTPGSSKISELLSPPPPSEVELSGHQDTETTHQAVLKPRAHQFFSFIDEPITPSESSSLAASTHRVSFVEVTAQSTNNNSFSARP